MKKGEEKENFIYDMPKNKHRFQVISKLIYMRQMLKFMGCLKN